MPDSHINDNPALLDALLTRRSVVVKNMVEPGPNEEQLALILQAAHRVPDHGKIGPWRFIVFTKERRAAFGEILQARFRTKFPEASVSLIKSEGKRFERAPVVIAVVSSPIKHKVPKWEQELSAGAVCQNILLATQSLGFSGQWLTEWCAFDDVINHSLSLSDKERIAGFIYIGSTGTPPKERIRPSLDERIQYY